jgi:hypothetical protein
MGNICDIFSKNNHDIYHNNVVIGIPVEEYNSNKNKYNDISYNINSHQNNLNYNPNQYYPIVNQYYPNSNSNPNQPVIVVNNQQPYYYDDPMIFAMEGFMSGVLIDELIGD